MTHDYDHDHHDDHDDDDNASQLRLGEWVYRVFINCTQQLVNGH